MLNLIRTIQPEMETAGHYSTVLLCLAFSCSPLRDQKTSKMLHTGFGSSLDGTPTGLIDVLMKKDAKAKSLTWFFLTSRSALSSCQPRVEADWNFFLSFFFFLKDETISLCCFT